MARDATPPERVMMPAHTTAPQSTSIYSYLHSQSGLNFAPKTRGSPPVRDVASLKGVKYGPGHEKYPSWPVPAEPSSASNGGGSHRSKSWTDQTHYPKEKGIPYTKPFMKRPNPQYTQQDVERTLKHDSFNVSLRENIARLARMETLTRMRKQHDRIYTDNLHAEPSLRLKTVMERCEKITLETFEPRPDILENSHSRMYLPKVDREGKILGDNEYMVPSPPERDLTTKPHLTQADLEEYARTYHELVESSVKSQHTRLTRAELEEYSRTYDEGLQPMHQQQPSYAQSEGYHSYVSSTDSTTTTPFLDRLRQSSEAPGPQVAWEERGRDSVVTTSSGSASSSETLKWHGSLSDLSVASSSCAQPPSRQLIAHSSRVQTPQKHNSESVLYLDRVQRNKLRLFPVSTYTVQPEEQHVPRSVPISPPSQPTMSVAERISELEKQQLQTRYTYLDPEKRHRVSDPTLKAIQKKALLSYYERHQQSWRSEPQLAPQSSPPQPPPRPRVPPPSSSSSSSRRASSASDYAPGSRKELKGRESNNSETANPPREIRRHQHSNSCGSLSADLLGPLIVGPSISVDDWVPERPPKKPHLRANRPPPPVPDRLPSPDLPPPSPPPVFDDEVFVSDEPLPPPPPELRASDTTESVYQNHTITANSYTNGEKIDASSNSNEKPATPPKNKENALKSSSMKEVVSPNRGKVTSPKNDERHYVISNMLQKCESSNEAMQRFAKNNILSHKNSKTPSPLSSPTATTTATTTTLSPPVTTSCTTNNDFLKNNYVRSKSLNNADNEKHQLSFTSCQNFNVDCENSARNSSYLPNPKQTCLPNSVENSKQTKYNSSNSESQRNHWTNNFIQKSIDNVSSSQRYLESHSSSSSLFENSFSSQKVNGEVCPTQHRYQQWNLNKKNVGDTSNYCKQKECDRISDSIINNCLTKQQPANNIQDKLSYSNTNPVYSVNSELKNNARQDIFQKVESKSVDLISNKQFLESCFPVETESQQHNSDKKYLGSGNTHIDNSKISANNSENSNSSKHFSNYFPKSFSLKHINQISSDNGTSVTTSQPSDSFRTHNATQKLIVNGQVATSLREWTPQTDKSSGSSNINCGCANSMNVSSHIRCHDSRVSEVLPNLEHSRLSLPPSSGVTRYSPPRRCSLLRDQIPCEQSSSKVSYLATSYRRDKDLPNFEGSYKRTMSPSESHKPIECETVPSDCRIEVQPEPSHLITPPSPEKTSISSIESREQNIRDDTSHSVDDAVHNVETSSCVSGEHYENGDSGVELSTSCSEVEIQCDLSNTSHNDTAPCESPPLLPPPSPPPHVTEGLQLVQRSEVVLRVNAATSDVASQTEIEKERTASPTVPTLVRQKLQEEIECERLSLDLASHLPPTDKLQGILVQGPDHKKTTDYVSGLFRLDIPARPRSKVSLCKQESNNSCKSEFTTCNGHLTSHKEGENMANTNLETSLPSSSAYFTTSESKAKFLTRYSNDVGHVEQLATVENDIDLLKKKEELMNRLGRKLEVLRGEHSVVVEESKVNDDLGEAVSSQVSRLAHPQEVAKYKLHVEEVGKITSLLLGLSGRLARAENALLGLPEHHSEKKILESKRDKLKEQLEEAKKLKENIDRRSVCVSNILCKYFTDEQYADYDHFINMKAKLIVDSREIADKIKLGEEQLAALKETLTKPD